MDANTLNSDKIQDNEKDIIIDSKIGTIDTSKRL